MKIIDTHAHLFVPEFEKDLDEVVSRAKKNGVTKVLLPNIATETIDAVKKASETYPDFFLPMMGIHPTCVGDDWQADLEKVHTELLHNKYIAIGEIGIDLYWDKSRKEQQVMAFETQLQWSKEMQLPVSIHSRDAVKEVIESIQKVGVESITGVFHSFGGNADELKQILLLRNFYIGVNGVVTFKNSGLDEVIKHAGLQNILLETDSPYLAPTPHRGKRNEPSYLTEILQKLAQIFGVSAEEVAQITTRNAAQLFHL